jgi:hypothetical protein
VPQNVNVDINTQNSHHSVQPQLNNDQSVAHNLYIDTRHTCHHRQNFSFHNLRPQNNKETAYMATHSDQPNPATPDLGRTRNQTRTRHLLDAAIRSLTPSAFSTPTTDNTSPPPLQETLPPPDNTDQAVEESKTLASDTKHLATIPPSQEGKTPLSPNSNSTDETTTNINTPTTLDQENASQILAQQVKHNVNAMNNDLDNADANDDSAFAHDLVNAVQNLLEEAINSNDKSPRKLQNWIIEIQKIYEPLFNQLPQSENVILEKQQFHSLIEAANKTYDDWLITEVNDRLTKEKEAMDKL